ncbi:transcriptional repressor, partial [Gammaproteobacteria bacterium]|nr:transcriptional repressor [Gammaproteobacteria bacterium]
GLATIYRVLTQFESAGMVTKHHFENSKAVYEINPDEHHDHMVDVDTGKVMEFHDEDLEKLQHEIAKKKGYELVDHSMILHVRKIES